MYRSTTAYKIPLEVRAEDTLTCAYARQRLFENFVAALTHEAIPYCILSGYEGYPQLIPSDVDFMVSQQDFGRLPRLLARFSELEGIQLVQFLRHETSGCWFVLANVQGRKVAYLHPDATSDFRRGGRLWLRSRNILAARRQHPSGFWIPAAADEFEYYLVKRFDKASLTDHHAQRLLRLFSEDSIGCREVLGRLLPADARDHVAGALESGNPAVLTHGVGALRSAILNHAHQEPWHERMWHTIWEISRYAYRVLRPTGLVVAVVGLDGSGKTTVIKHMATELAPAFRTVECYHSRPHFGRKESAIVVNNPHAQPPRGSVASLAKLVLFLVDYWVAFLGYIRLQKIRSSLIIFDRYYHDMLADPLRYRVPVAFSPARWMAGLIPKPDLWLFLDVSPETAVARKNEISVERAQALRAAYLTLVNTLDQATTIDVNCPLPDVLQAANKAVLGHLERRTLRRLGLAD